MVQVQERYLWGSAEGRLQGLAGWCGGEMVGLWGMYGVEVAH